ncbi:right-handed parallel beta-helix repeat-containing protein [Methanolobus psychrotolerans]|uniref:right-handed parallel beta-helix repeat-containing protein n=1 Tax=Methanolobus psychrotolerans TaxID=1874706 RepID=UPI0013EA057A|nr:NosD domain-containing protein [Methanolobus psychrotolerans]
MNSSEANNSFSSIQDAIDFSQANDSIVIYDGIYSEVLIIDKPLELRSSSLNPNDVIIVSDEASTPIIHVISNNVEITGLTITGKDEGQPVSGVFLDNVENSLINNNKISNTQDGILVNRSSGNYIQNNVLSSNTVHGIYLVNSNDNDLIENRIHDNERGLYLKNSSRNVVEQNEAYDNLYYGIALLDSDTNNITNNRLFLNEFGLSLTGANYNLIRDNYVCDNEQHGFLLWEATSNNLKGNFLARNEDSGVYLKLFCSNNIVVENCISSNLNGISIGESSNNFIMNNTFSSNENYAIFHLLAGDENIIKGNTFQDNSSENKKIVFWQQIVLFILAFAITALIAYYFKISWLKKGLFGLGILIIVSLILLIAWYFPFESDLPANNVYVENLEFNASPINETHSSVALSMNLNYLYKNSFSHSNEHGEMTDQLPVIVQVISSTHANGPNSDTREVLESEEEIVLEYLGENPYECTIDLESGKEYSLAVHVQMIEELPYPHPYYGEMRWEFLGGHRERLDLR